MQPANQHSGFEGEKEKILGRIREALRTEAPHPGHGLAVDRQDEKHGPQSSPIRQWLPFAGETFSEKLELFKSNATMLRAQFALLESKDELLACIQSLREEERWTKVGSHSGQLTDLVCRELKLPICRTDQPYQAADLETCNVGITECDALIAQTGSVLVTSRSAGGRALSILPPHHVVLARRDQLLRDLPEGFELLKRSYPPSYPSFISFITGPSRTGDIERILVLGAHGPKKLTILCV